MRVKLACPIIYYKQRWQIQTLFGELQSSGFNIKDTHVTDLERLEKLYSLTIIAFVFPYKIGDYLNEYIPKIKIKKYGAKAVIVFKYE